jgi:hypothetical protein
MSLNIFISGPITSGNTATQSTVLYNRLRLRWYAWRLKAKRPGAVVLNPAILPLGMAYSDYMAICRSMIDRCDALVLAPGWEQSTGACDEATYAVRRGIDVCQWGNLT